jgi:peptidoglycan-N-acetylglucosamine deacetylase
VRSVVVLAAVVAVVLLGGCGAHPGATGTPPAAACAAPAGTVALTFDDGPDAGTARILDELAAYGAHATFFVRGDKARARPDLIAREVREGHTVANHTDDHAHLPALGAAGIRAELAAANQAIMAAGAGRPRLLRPPYGEGSPLVSRIAAELGLRVVLWTDDSGDWRGDPPGRITANVLSRIRPDAVVLFHDGLTTAGATADALPAILHWLATHRYCAGAVPASAPSAWQRPRSSVSTGVR